MRKAYVRRSASPMETQIQLHSHSQLLAHHTYHQVWGLARVQGQPHRLPCQGRRCVRRQRSEQSWHKARKECPDSSTAIQIPDDLSDRLSVRDGLQSTFDSVDREQRYQHDNSCARARTAHCQQIQGAVGAVLLGAESPLAILIGCEVGSAVGCVSRECHKASPIHGPHTACSVQTLQDVHAAHWFSVMLITGWMSCLGLQKDLQTLEGGADERHRHS